MGAGAERTLKFREMSANNPARYGGVIKKARSASFPDQHEALPSGTQVSVIGSDDASSSTCGT